MTDYKLNTRIEWTEEDRKRGKCPVPAGSDVTVWLYDGSVARNGEPEDWPWSECSRHITAYLIHSVPREPREWWVVKSDSSNGAFCEDEKHARRLFEGLENPEGWEITKVREVLEENEEEETE